MWYVFSCEYDDVKMFNEINVFIGSMMIWYEKKSLFYKGVFKY